MSSDRLAPEEDKKRTSLSFNYVKNYLLTRIGVSSVVGGLLGGSAGYFVGGDMLFRLGTGWTIAGGVIGLQFYGTALMCQIFRQTDDWINYGISGSFSLVSAMKYLEHSKIIPRSGAGAGASALILGFTSGVLYKFAEEGLYVFAREKWIKNRYLLKHEAKIQDFPGVENYSGRTPGYYTQREPSTVPAKPWNYPGRPYMPNAPIESVTDQKK